MNIIRTRQLLAHVQVARSLLAAIETGCHLRLESGQSIEKADLERLSAFWQQQLSYAINELDAAQRLVEQAARSGKGPVQHG